jgi:hypothetical protein
MTAEVPDGLPLFSAAWWPFVGIVFLVAIRDDRVLSLTDSKSYDEVFTFLKIAGEFPLSATFRGAFMDL